VGLPGARLPPAADSAGCLPPSPARPCPGQVDGDALEGGRPAPQALEEDETISVELVPLGPDLGERLRAFEAHGFGVWVGLHALAQGMQLGAMYGI
jgi:hypothetical protein